MNEIESRAQALEAFVNEIGVSEIATKIQTIGNREFLKFIVGRESPLFSYALYNAQARLSDDNVYKGALGLETNSTSNFPNSVEASALLTLLTRSTKEVSQGNSFRGFTVPYVPFQKREDHQLAQPASHVVRGRRGVGKSTLIRRADTLLRSSSAVVAVLDSESYTTLRGDDLKRELLYDICLHLANSPSNAPLVPAEFTARDDLSRVGADIASGKISLDRAPVAIKRVLSALTRATGGNVYVFLDDFHLIDRDSQPEILQYINAALKGANAWLKVAGITSLLNIYSAKDQKGIQIPGDAQYVPLDLTLENPEAAEAHLRAILEQFLEAVGYSMNSSVMAEGAFRRLAWANAGVPRDFLQMFARSLEHANRNRHAAVTLSDVNVAIGEFGQQKMQELEFDARNVAGSLRETLEMLEALCLDKSKINAFLVRSGNSRERAIVQILSDLRLVHLIHQSITPDKAGQRFEAFILDYSLFTGFRRRPNIKEMLPKQSQFKASELRALPKVLPGFFNSVATGADPA